MAEDAEARLLDGIVGKYGDDSDYGDLVNADEDALLEGFDDADFEVLKDSSAYHDSIEEPEQDEPDAEDVLDLVAQDGELEDEVEDGSGTHITNTTYVSSTTQPEGNTGIYSQSQLEERERNTDKFKNERQNPASKSYNIPDSLDEVSVQNSGRNNWYNQRMGGQRGRGGGRGGNQRNNQMQKGRTDNKTVLINPHFKGHVKINSDARLAWDARHRINQNKNQNVHQGGRAPPFSQNVRKPNQSVNSNIQPWINNVGNGMPTSNVQHFQPPPTVYQPVFQPPPQVPQNWNQYQPNTFNQVASQMGMPPSQQNVFMQPIPQFPNQSAMPQFNQSQPQFNSQPPMFQNPNMTSQPPPVFQNPQFSAPQMNQFSQPNEPTFHPSFQQNQPPSFNPPNNANQFIHPQSNMQFNQPVHNRFAAPNPAPNNNNNQFQRNQQRFARPKPNFNQGKPHFNQKIMPKRKMEGNMDQRKIKKRTAASTNLHEVPTVETPDTTVKEEKLPQEDEDEETKVYRKKIEEQKRLRLKVLAEKEKRRQQSIQKLKQAENTHAVTITSPKSISISMSVPKSHQQQYQQQQQKFQQQQQQPYQHQPHQQQQQQRPRQIPQKNLLIRWNQQHLRNIQRSTESYPTATTASLITQQPSNRNIKIINTSADESNIDKQHLASFLSNRKILAKDQSLVDTSVVVISNLTAGTTDVKLRKMCQGIGDIKKLQMSPKERQATIQFNSVASAHAFFKKYQRTMLDLSMIQVSLKPMP